MLPDEFLLLILSSPSGAGKTTLARKLLELFPDLRFSISHTTRKPRANEVDGRDYHFVDRTEFERLVTDHKFVEWAEVHGNLYGTCLHEIENARAAGCTGMIFDIDYQGARQIRAKLPDVTGVFILPPSMAELERRLRGRASETEDVVQRRFKAARREIEHYALFDYVLVNDDFESAFATLRGILLAERARRERKAHVAESLLRS
ncbi:guanylate kinase [Pendulispora rubella]|uniref:Guanylate kinase n=1 Tax=Pendulispora rubella TaxID=2741070 RepID=A0ABZ2KRG7_9BACT